MLRSFTTAGRPPAASDLAETAARYATTAETVLAALHTDDFLRLAADGQIRAAYPFSAVPTPHLVDLDGGPRVHAMCAIDALGIAAMIRAAVTITSADPRTADPVTITVRADGTTATWQPQTAVVFAGRHTSCEPCETPAGARALPAAAQVSCGYVNFFTTPPAPPPGPAPTRKPPARSSIKLLPCGWARPSSGRCSPTIAEQCPQEVPISSGDDDWALSSRTGGTGQDAAGI